MAYYRLECWGNERSDYQTGIIASTMANIFRSKQQRVFRPEDFMPRERKITSIDEQIAKLKAVMKG